MIYVFKSNKILKEDNKISKIPKLVTSMLENTSTLPYYFQKVSYAHALFFTYKETKIYNTVLDACNVRVKYMQKLMTELHEKCNQMTLNIHKLIAQKDMSNEILNFDVKQYLKHFSQDATHWNDSFTNVANEIEKLSELCQRFVKRFNSAYRRNEIIFVTSEKIFSKHCEHALNKM